MERQGNAWWLMNSRSGEQRLPEDRPAEELPTQAQKWSSSFPQTFGSRSCKTDGDRFGNTDSQKHKAEERPPRITIYKNKVKKKSFMSDQRHKTEI